MGGMRHRREVRSSGIWERERERKKDREREREREVRRQLHEQPIKQSFGAAAAAAQSEAVSFGTHLYEIAGVAVVDRLIRFPLPVGLIFSG